ncbi:MAG: hypothetical protein WDW36_007689 [Sanguina aurantia]
MAAMPGAPKIPKFKVLKMLGQGSYGKVYKVQRLTDSQEYALKETDLEAMSQAERSDSVNEVRLLVSINHPNVIRYNEAFVVGNKLNVVMEYAPFGDLRYYITKGIKLRAPFPEEAIWRIFLQLCRGLEALHASAVVHRDIKPANIFLCQNDLLKIGDLGIAKALDRHSFARTQIGTPSYMAPEVWSGKLYSCSSDLWSLGAVLYEMMTFRTPMEGRSMVELKSNVIRGNYAPVPSGRYSQELITFCHSLLCVEPNRRPLPGAILQSVAASKWIRVLPVSHPAQSRRGSDPSGLMLSGASRTPLLDTIVVPRDLRQLDKHLPPPSYDSDPTHPEPSSRSSNPSCNHQPHVHPPQASSENRPPPPAETTRRAAAAAAITSTHTTSPAPHHLCRTTRIHPRHLPHTHPTPTTHTSSASYTQQPSLLLLRSSNSSGASSIPALSGSSGSSSCQRCLRSVQGG